MSGYVLYVCLWRWESGERGGGGRDRLEGGEKKKEIEWRGRREKGKREGEGGGEKERDRERRKGEFMSVMPFSMLPYCDAHVPSLNALYSLKHQLSNTHLFRLNEIY